MNREIYRNFIEIGGSRDKSIIKIYERIFIERIINYRCIDDQKKKKKNGRKWNINRETGYIVETCLTIATSYKSRELI